MRSCCLSRERATHQDPGVDRGCPLSAAIVRLNWHMDGTAGENYVARPPAATAPGRPEARPVVGNSLARGQEPEGSRQAEVGGVTQPDP